MAFMGRTNRVYAVLQWASLAALLSVATTPPSAAEEKPFDRQLLYPIEFRCPDTHDGAAELILKNALDQTETYLIVYGPNRRQTRLVVLAAEAGSAEFKVVVDIDLTAAVLDPSQTREVVGALTDEMKQWVSQVCDGGPEAASLAERKFEENRALLARNQ